ncbi:hypothetical protein [Yinghuangia seranimata]|uniref:hypothetical protein n=1 Tax=Yinghuangia seranimata TaxID=408067 RepID=UPI00248B84EB|nr:hypothetical protein [Yinghuangia seranimata]MDI2130588.1 hypothetical protein [Yinghuangia seranimata]
MPLGTRMVRDHVGVDPYELVLRHKDDEALAALASLLVTTATRLDFFDTEAARDIAHASTEAARAAADPDTHLGLSGAWTSLAQQAGRIDTGLARIAELRQTLNAELVTYTRVLAAHRPGGHLAPPPAS